MKKLLLLVLTLALATGMMPTAAFAEPEQNQEQTQDRNKAQDEERSNDPDPAQAQDEEQAQDPDPAQDVPRPEDPDPAQAQEEEQPQDPSSPQEQDPNATPVQESDVAEVQEQDPAQGQEAETLAASAATSKNLWNNNYSTWTQPTTSYLSPQSDGTFERIEWIKGKLVVERYSSSAQYVSSIEVAKNTYTPSNLASGQSIVWGGFYGNASNNFIITGQNNPTENNNLSVVRVAKYSKNWTFLASYELKNANSTEIFCHGSFKVAETGGKLFMRSAHKMYKASDGRIHQSNITIVLDPSTMTLAGGFWDVGNFAMGYGYVSHSFCQNITTLGTTVYAADHGDAHPRSMAVTKVNNVTTGSSMMTSAFPLTGATGFNTTYATLGGLESSSTASNLLMVGSAADQTTTASSSSPQNVAHNAWLTVTKSDLSTTNTIKLTNYADNSPISATTPVLVKVNENKFMIAWGTYEGALYPSKYYDEISYMFVDGNGTALSSVRKVPGNLSDCQPVVQGGKIRWYSTGIPATSGETTPIFYAIDIATYGYISSNPLTFAEASISGTFTYDGNEHRPEPAVVLGGTTLVKNTDYTLSYKNNVNAGKATVTITGKGAYAGQTERVFTIDPFPFENTTFSLAGNPEYTGSVVMPKVTATYNGMTLVEGVDYTLTPDGSPINAGSWYRVWIAGKGNYASYIWSGRYYMIVQSSLTTAKITLPYARATYSGKALTPAPTITKDGRTLVAGTDYEVSYSNNAKPGTATVTITGKGNYTATVTKKFTIDKADINKASVSGINASYEYSGSALKPSPKVTFSKATLKENTDYKLTYSGNIAVGTATITITGMGCFTGTRTVTFTITKKGVPAPRPIAATFERLAGADRYKTMSSILKAGFKKGDTDTVIIATGENYPDALAASALAGLYNAPIVLTPKASLAAEAKSEITRLGAKKALIIGSDSAVSSSVEGSLKKMGLTTERVMGSNRVETSVKIYEKGKSAKSGWGDTAIIASGLGFADALSISSYAYAQSYPIFLADGNKVLTPEVSKALSSGGFKNVIIVGSDAAVSSKVEGQLSKIGLGSKQVTRLGGTDRFDTSFKIARYTMGKGMKADKLAVATGANFPDALAGAALCGKNRSVILLVADNSTGRGHIKGFLDTNKKKMNKGYALGSSAVVSDALLTYIKNSCKY